MNLRLQKVGNSFMVTIPKYIKEKTGLALGKEKKPIISMIGNRQVKKFNFKKSMQYIKEASYAR